MRHWGRKWLVDFNAGKTQLVSFDQSNNTGAIDVKVVGFVLVLDIFSIRLFSNKVKSKQMLFSFPFLFSSQFSYFS